MTETKNSGSLYVVATPIGNLGDLTRRAETVLKSVQIVAAEDTRRTARLLAHIDVRVPELVSLHEHNEANVAPKLIERLLAGDDVALVSDAGTPLINDPGFGLLQLALQAHITTVPLPGASALTTLLSVCPLPCQPFRFIGFLASKPGARQRQLQDCLTRADASVFLEAPHRIRETLTTLAELTSRRIFLGRELTKQYETLMTGTATEVLAALGEPRGEFIGLIEAEAATEQTAIPQDQQTVMRLLLKELAPAQAAKIAAALFNQKKSTMYDLALTLSK